MKGEELHVSCGSGLLAQCFPSPCFLEVRLSGLLCFGQHNSVQCHQSSSRVDAAGTPITLPVFPAALVAGFLDFTLGDMYLVQCIGRCLVVYSGLILTDPDYSILTVDCMDAPPI